MSEESDGLGVFRASDNLSFPSLRGCTTKQSRAKSLLPSLVKNTNNDENDRWHICVITCILVFEMKLPETVIICLLSLSLNSCFNLPQETITVRNNSDSTVYVYYGCENFLRVENPLRVFDTDFFNGRQHIYPPRYRLTEYAARNVVLAQDIERLVRSCPDGKMKLFIIPEKTIRNNTWEEICRKRMYVQKMEFTADELESMLWQVAYTP